MPIAKDHKEYVLMEALTKMSCSECGKILDWRDAERTVNSVRHLCYEANCCGLRFQLLPMEAVLLVTN